MFGLDKHLPEGSVHNLTLSFQGEYKNLEDEYRRSYLNFYIKRMRVILLINTLLLVAGTVIKLVFFPSATDLDYLLTFVSMIFCTGLAYFFTFRSRFEYFSQTVLSSTVLLAGVGLLAMMIYTPVPHNEIFFTGVLLVMFLIYTIFRIRFVFAFFVGWLLFFLTLITSVFIVNFPLDILIGYLILLFLANIIGMVSSYNLEIFARRDFFLQRGLVKEKETAEQTNLELEESVQINTQHLSKVIRKLEEEVQERKQVEQKLDELSTRDHLTELPNRTLFNDRLKQAINRAARHGRPIAVMLLDLDNFKTINEVYSHKHGDQILFQAGRRLKECLRQYDTVSRLGDDEFVVLVEDISSTDQMTGIAEKVLEAVSKPFDLDDHQVIMTASMGISTYPENGDNADILINNAEAAMRAAKVDGKNNYRFSSPEMTKMAVERVTMGVNLRLALEREEFVVYYQPQVNLVNKKIIGIEALLRWNSAEKGLVYPGQIIPIAEETGLIVPIGEWVIRSSCEQMKAWESKGLPLARVSINLSTRQLRQPERLISFIRGVLDDTKLDPQWLELELTENIVFEHIDNINDILNEFSKLGIRLAIDDFGAGYSTLGQLAHLPFNTLKIDRSFAVNLENSDKDAAVTSGIISIAQKLGKQVVAEGIETQYQIDFYKSQGCHIIQGWYFSKAVSAEKIEEYLRYGFSSDRE